MLRPVVFSIAAVCSLTLSLIAQRPAVRTDTYVRSEMSREQIPGVAVAVLKNGRVEFLKTYGFANLEHRVKTKPSTVFQSGSLAKQFTAAAVMLLVQDRKLALDDPVSRYLTDAPPSWTAITVRRLLDHTAGLGNFGDEVDLRRDYTEAEFWDLIKKSPLRFEPGTDWDYSNLGYVTLGILIHRVSGEFYGDVLTRRVFMPLGMSASRVISESDLVPNRAAGYRLVDGDIKNQEWVSPSNNTTADGSLYVTLLDLIKWDRGLSSNSPLSAATLRQIWTPGKLVNGRETKYGLGWHLGRIGDKRVAFHGGAWQGFKTFIARVLDDGRTFILLANSWDAHEFKIAQHLMAVYYPELRHREWSTIRDSDPSRTARVRHYLMGIVNGKGTGAATDSERKVRERLRSLSLPVAIINTSELVDSGTKFGRTVYRCLLTDVLESFVLTAEFGTDDRITGIKLEPA